MIEELHHTQVGIPAGGVERAREFYCGLLGLKEVHRPFGPNGLWVRVGARTVHFGIDEADRSRSRSHVAYQVADLAEMRRRLTQAGYAIEEAEKMPGHDRFQIRDPFGNHVEFIQPEMKYSAEEIAQTLLSQPGMRIERIVSRGHASPDGFWYDQADDEWVMLLKGAARLRFEGEEPIELTAGAFVNIPAHRRHRVEWTIPGQETVWLAIYHQSE